MERRYGGDAFIEYHDLEDAANRERYADQIKAIEERGLLYPVTAIDGMLVYDGAVSYPAILRAVHNKLLERDEATQGV